VLATKKWKKFEQKIKKTGKKAQDDVDLVFAFSNYAEKLLFSHTLLFRSEQADAGAGALKSQFSFRTGQVSLEEKSPYICAQNLHKHEILIHSLLFSPDGIRSFYGL